jgi:drug/metabolite transporter (DMT)-like permease
MIKGISLMLIGCLVLTAGDALMKSLVQSLPVGQTVGLRALFALATVLLIVPWAGGFHRLRVRAPGKVLLVSGLLVFNLFVFPISLRYLPLADAIILAYTSPIWVVALAPVLLKEQVGWRQWLAVLVGFLGACLVIKPGASIHWAVLLPLVVALSVGLRDIATRKIAATEHALAIVFIANALTIVIGMTTLPFGWVEVDLTQWGQMAVSGLFLSVAQILMIEGFRLVEASVLSIFKYSSIVFAALFGYLFWGELLDFPSMMGALLIMSSGLLIVHYRHRTIPMPAEVIPRQRPTSE